MSPLKTVLANLCANKGIDAAIIITSEGMVIERRVSENIDDEAVAAFMSQVAQTIRNSLGSMGGGEFTRYSMQSNQGRVYLENLGKSLLIAVGQIDVDPGQINVAIFQAANEIRKMGRLVV